MKLKALFIGGTGNISSEITKLCARTGWDVTLINRGQRAGNLPEDIKVTNWVLDINDENAVRDKMKNEHFDVVANFINFVPEQIERDIRLFAGKTNQYMFISSASAYQKPLSCQVITESTPLYNPFWEYSRNKIACEDRLTAEYRANGFPYTIVRPSHTYGESYVPVSIHGKNGSWAVMKRMLEGKPVLVQGDGSSLWTLTHSKDFAVGFVGLMANIHAMGEAVHITSDEILTWNQIINCIGNALGLETAPKIAHVTTDFLAACDPVFNGGLHGDKSNSVIFDNSKLKRLVPGFTAKIRFDQGIRRSVDYILKHPELQKDDSEFDLFCDRVIAAQEAAVVHFQQAR